MSLRVNIDEVSYSEIFGKHTVRLSVWDYDKRLAQVCVEGDDEYGYELLVAPGASVKYTGAA